MIQETIEQALAPSSRLFRVGFWLAVMGLSAWFGWIATGLHLSSLSGFAVLIPLIIFAAFLLVTLRRIEYGVVALVFTAFFVRAGFSTGSASRIPPSMILSATVIFVWLLQVLIKHRLELFRSRVTLPLILFVVTATISMPWSWLFWRPDLFLWRATSSSNLPFEIVQTGALSVMVLLPLVLLLAMNTLRDRKWYIYLTVLVTGIGLPELIQRQLNYTPTFGPISLSGPGLYHVWLVGLIAGQVFFNDDLKLWMRILLAALGVGWLLWAFVGKLSWISGWGPPFLALWFVVFLKSKRAALVLIVIAFIPIMLRPDYYYQQVFVESQNSDFNRFWLWRTIVFDLTLSRADAILGTGPAGYAPYFQTYYPNRGMSAHNNYVDIISETGIIGFSFFVWFLLATFKSGFQQRNQISDKFLLAFNNGVLGGFVGMLAAMMLNDWFLPFAYNTTIGAFDWNVYAWILLGAMIGLKRFVTVSSSKPVPKALTSATQPVSTGNSPRL